ncbi:MAG: hypothetical protein UH687_08350 [Bacteroidaceae bacterium]|nr:hypothetical protein [Bacteroidaceae bacterium]
MNNKIQWIDFKALKRDDKDDNWGAWDFFAWNNPENEPKWYELFIPGWNILKATQCVILWILSPLRFGIVITRMRKLSKNAYDIENVNSLYRIIRNKAGDLGLCEWGGYYSYGRRVVLKSIYLDITRYQQDLYIVTDKNNKMGLFSTETHRWIFPCSCDNIDIESNDIINVTINNKSQRYNSKGDRIVS